MTNLSSNTGMRWGIEQRSTIKNEKGEYLVLNRFFLSVTTNIRLTVENKDKIDKSLEKYNKSELAKEEIENLNIPWSMK